MSYTAIDPNSQLAWYMHGNSAGLGAYANVGYWTWEFNGIEYAGMDPADSAAQPAPILGKGMGCADPAHPCSSCKSGGGCGGHSHGMGQATGIFGTNLFSSTDVSTWGWGEWLAVGVALYAVLNIVSDVKGAAGSVSRSVRKSRSRAKRRAQAQADLF